MEQESQSAPSAGEHNREGSTPQEMPSVASVFENEANERSYLDAMDPRLSVRQVPQSRNKQLPSFKIPKFLVFLSCRHLSSLGRSGFLRQRLLETKLLSDGSKKGLT